MISCSEIVSEEEVVFLVLCLVKMLHLRLLESCVSLQNHKGRKSMRVKVAVPNLPTNSVATRTRIG
jgi:hypothetical protein